MGQPPTTYQLAQKAVSWAEKEKIEKIWLVAIPPHQLRCWRDLCSLIEEKDSRIDLEVCENIKFNKKTYLFWAREIPLLLMPFWIYKKRIKNP
jgi:hypothetical protein